MKIVKMHLDFSLSDKIKYLENINSRSKMQMAFSNIKKMFVTDFCRKLSYIIFVARVSNASIRFI